MYGRKRVYAPSKNTKDGAQKKYKKTYSRKLTTYKKPRFNPWSIPLTGNGDKKWARLRYAEQFNINPPGSGPVAYTFSANGLFDPNITGIGHQPRGFDQLMALYNHYQVIESKCYFKYANITGGNEVPVYYDIFITDAGNRVNSWSAIDFLENKEATGKAYQVGTERGYIGAPIGLTKYWKSKDFFAMPQNTSSLRGDASNNPVDQAYFECGVCPIQGVDAPTLNFVVVIEYIAVFTERRTLTVS